MWAASKRNKAFAIECVNPAANNPGERRYGVIFVILKGFLLFGIKHKHPGYAPARYKLVSIKRTLFSGTKNIVQTAFNRPAVVTDFWPKAGVARKTILPARYTRARRWHRDTSRVLHGMAQHISVSVVTVAIR